MIDEIVQLLRQIGDFFVNLADFVVGLFRDLVYMAKLLRIVPRFINQFLDIFPEAIVTILICFVSVALIYKLFGREG